MTPYLQDPDVTLYHGDVLEVLRELPDESVDCAATSPPFYGLRDYGTGRWEGGDDEGCEHKRRNEYGRAGKSFEEYGSDAGYAPGSNFANHKALDEGEAFRDTCGKCGARRIDQQIGLEATPEEWRDRLVEVFREVRRVLVPTGTLWVECGDSYNGAGSNNQGRGSESLNDGRSDFPVRDALHDSPGTRVVGLKPKDLIGAPFLLAFGLRDDGWWWRSTNIWHKPNCLPESVTDRPVVSHSYVFQFSKKARYFHDAEAVREPYLPESIARDGRARLTAYTPPGQFARSEGERCVNDGRSLRSVWTIPTQGFPEAHFATWPTKLAERILLQACPESVCRVCGVPRTRITSTEYENPGNRQTNGPRSVDARDDPMHGTINSRGSRLEKRVATEGFTDCGHSDYRPGICLDPFVGSGTTCHVARKLGRRSIGIDLSAEYLDLAAKRLQQQSLFA